MSQISVRGVHGHQTLGKIIPESLSQPQALDESPGVKPPVPALGAGPFTPGLLCAHQPPQALSSPNTLGNLDNFAAYFPHTRSLPHPECCKTTPSAESLASGNFFLPSRPGMGLRAELAMMNSRDGSTPQPHPVSPQAFGEEIGCFGLVQCPVLWRPVQGDHCAGALMATGIIWLKTQ